MNSDNILTFNLLGSVKLHFVKETIPWAMWILQSPDLESPSDPYAIIGKQIPLTIVHMKAGQKGLAHELTFWPTQDKPPEN